VLSVPLDRLMGAGVSARGVRKQKKNGGQENVFIGGSVRRRFSRHDCQCPTDLVAWYECQLDYLSRTKTPQSSSAEVPLDKGSLGRQRLPAKTGACAHGATVLGAIFGLPRDDFSFKIMGHWSHALKKPRSWVCARFRRIEPKKCLLGRE